MGGNGSDNRNTPQPKIVYFVAKVATDINATSGHNPPGMGAPPDRNAFNELLRNAGLNSDADAWLKATGSAERSKINKILTGKRKIKRTELVQLASALNVRVRVLEKVLGDEVVLGLTSKLIIAGTISQGGEVVFAAKDTRISLDAFYSDTVHSFAGNVLKVIDDTTASRLQKNDLVGYGDPEDPSDRLDGMEVVVCMKDGRTLVRRMHRTDSAGSYTFTSVGTGSNAPPETSDQIQWVARIEAIFPPDP